MAYSQMLMSANEVIWRRTTQMATGTMTQPEATGMVLEKVTAMAKATEKASVAAAKGATPAGDHERGAGSVRDQDAFERSSAA